MHKIGKYVSVNVLLNSGCVYRCSTTNLTSHFGLTSFKPAKTCRYSTSTVAAMHERAAAVLEYWEGIRASNKDLHAWDGSKFSLWFRGGPAVDEEIKSKFGADVEAIAAGKYDAWKSSDVAQETVAGIILMDQFTRNMYRNQAKMYSLDEKCMTWVRSLLDNPEAHKQLRWCDRIWVYMALMHCETLPEQQECIRQFQALSEEARTAGNEEVAAAVANNADYAKRHEVVVAKWGRFPHRNAILGRQSTLEELAGLADGSIGSF